jgi:SAM-dependent methyltransferase
MPGGLYPDPLSPEEREELEEDLISFCDWELDLIGDIRGLDVLYAGGSSALWIEGLGQRIGSGGSLTALDSDEERVEEPRAALGEADLAAPVRLVAGDVFEPPFGAGAFDLVYSAGLFHELNVRERDAQDALIALISVTRTGGRIAMSDFVDSVPAVQFEDEELQRELARIASGAELYGIGSPERLVALHETVLAQVRWSVSLPVEVRHLGKVVLAEGEPEAIHLLPAEPQRRLLGRLEALRKRVRCEGYTRLATLYLEGSVTRGGPRRA